MSLVASRARMIASRGRAVELARAGAEATVTAFLHAVRPEQIAGGLQAGDALLETAALPAPFAPPVKGDTVRADGRRWSVMGATPLHAGAVLAGYTLHLRGG